MKETQKESEIDGREEREKVCEAAGGTCICFLFGARRGHIGEQAI